MVTAGFVYEPSYVRRTSLVDADYWTYTINNVITEIDPNYAINQCNSTRAQVLQPGGPLSVGQPRHRAR